MNRYFLQLGNTVYRLLIIFLLYSISRVFFFFVNFQEFSGAGFFEILKIFIIGIRFDATAIIEINVLFIVLYLIPAKFADNRVYIKTLNILFLVVNALILLLNFTDAEYFKFTAKRSTADLFRYILISSDTATLMPQFLKDFWYIPISWLLTVLLGYFLLKKAPFKTDEKYSFTIKHFTYSILVFVGFLGILIVIARGLGLKPVRIITAARYTQSRNIPLLLNTPFCIIHTLQEKERQFKPYFNENELAGIYNPEQQFKTTTSRRDNIVIIILESFSREFVGSLTGKETYTPNLDSIIKQSLVFENAFANGKRSIDALPAIFAGMLPVSDESYISSRYASNALEAFPFVLSNLGYHTSFFHGGRNGTMGFDEFSRIAGIKHYYGLNEYKGPGAFDGNWGIYDEEFLSFFAKTMNTFPQPFLSSVFTLSSHHPYSVPARHVQKFPSAEPQLLKSTRYADYALGEFFKQATTMPWYKNTLFILLADHTAQQTANNTDNPSNAFRIPLVLFHPGDTSLKGRQSKIVQQTDIMPSVYEYLGITQPFVAFGNSIFSTDTTWAEYFLGGMFTFIENNTVITFDGEKTIAVDKLNKALANGGDSASKAVMEQKLKAIIQQSQLRIINNKFTVQKK